MTVRLYSSADAGAPVLRGNTPGDLINVLTKCLVEGYGGKSPAGWTRPFVGSNVAAFKQGPGSNGMYLRVDDTSTATSWRSARVVGYETMSDVNTGAAVSFPTPLKYPGGGHWYTHQSGAVANPREWWIVADEFAFYFMVSAQSPTPVNNYYQETYFFGDINSFKPGDTTHTMLTSTLRSSGNSSEGSPFESESISAVKSAAGQNLVLARSYTNQGGPIDVGWHGDMTKGGVTWSPSSSAGLLQYPHGPDGGMYLAPITVVEAGASSGPYNLRGTMPGLWQMLHAVLFPNGTVLEGSGALEGRSFFFRRHGTSGALIEISDTWR